MGPSNIIDLLIGNKLDNINISNGLAPAYFKGFAIQTDSSARAEES